MADFFDQGNTEGQNSPKGQQDLVYQPPAQNTAGGDDFSYFNAAPNGVPNNNQGGDQNAAFNEQAAYQAPYQAPGGDDFDFGGNVQQPAGQNNYAAFEQAVEFPRTEQESQEVIERRRRMHNTESAWTQAIIEKQEQESILKEKRRTEARAFLNQWKQDRERAIAAQKKINVQENEAKGTGQDRQKYKNPWDMIADNISLKASDYPGKKDITRMKESIINKKVDLGKQ